ncbi:hypothetical protein HMPREF0063_11687 [Aeromicrobium marinum DSM 15272]|uniref:Polyketide cyclase/dehydrase n=1 Tax=Aeromicrobium marinum DSM 15272 TaxID=585531 RepID=E2SDA1_9ACTN|nr:SRPBCC family protein [Aeromicrobium marinum]EFQ82478.1 hypothetical protein HMPREF0063_11687 [Aeromicrobium marinum DSM 15272]
MATSNVSAHLSLPPEEAWSLLSDLSRFEEWLTIHDAWRADPPAEFAVGSTFTQQVSVLGMANVIEWTVDAYDPPRSLTISGTGMAGVAIRFVLSVAADETGSVATIDAEFTGQMVVGAIGSAVEKSTTKELTASLETLQGLAA